VAPSFFSLQQQVPKVDLGMLLWYRVVQLLTTRVWYRSGLVIHATPERGVSKLSWGAAVSLAAEILLLLLATVATSVGL